MTPGRLAIIIMTKLHSEGFLNTASVGPPSKVIEKVITERINYGDVKCVPDGDELTWMKDLESIHSDDDEGC